MLYLRLFWLGLSWGMAFSKPQLREARNNYRKGVITNGERLGITVASLLRSL